MKRQYATYWATGKNTTALTKQPKGMGPLHIEFNKDINMYRINSTENRGVPTPLMGYNPHIRLLIQRARSYINHQKRAQR